MCFAQNETSPFNEQEYCDPDIDNTIWTLKPTTTSNYFFMAMNLVPRFIHLQMKKYKIEPINIR